MDFTLTKDQEQVLEKARWVAKERLAPRASQYDESATHPVDNWRDVWENGLLGIAIPKEYGGLGLDMLTYVMVIEELAKGCTSTAMTVHMHSVVQRYINTIGTPEQKSTFYPDVIERGKLFGSWGSEPDRHGGTGNRDTIISPRGDGYVINGKKHFCTMAGGAYRAVVHCTLEGRPQNEAYILALVPHDAQGMKIEGEWNPLGMRATVSPPVTFEDAYVSQDEIIGKPGTADKSGVGQSFGLGYAAVYIGIGQRALDFTKEYCMTHQIAPDPGPMAENLVVQRHVAEMAMALEGARLVTHQSAIRWEGISPVERSILTARAKYLAAEASLMATSRALQTIGGRSAHKYYPLERLFRDVRTCSLMPPNVDRSLEIIGKAEMEIEDALLRQRHVS